MISVKLVGRLANNLFQMSACIAHALKHGYDYCIPTKTENEKIWKSYRFDKVKYGDVKLPIYEEKTHRFYPIPNRDNICLSGYFQSIHHFEHKIDDIRELFGFTEQMHDCVSIHVRRGDYATMPKQFPMLHIRYYQKAMEIFPDSKFMVFSDDIEWCRKNFVGDQFEFDESDELTAIRLMARCKNNIIANSSFSLFASMMNRNPDKVVVSPKTFYGESARIDETTLIPESYIKI